MRTLYTIGQSYTFPFGHHTESAVYRGFNAQGMHCFAFNTGEVWTGFDSPVTPDRKTGLGHVSRR